MADYELFHPEIATIETLIEAPSMKEFFCTGNLHKCNVFCLQLKMAEIALGESEEDEE